ncbi:MAG: hypothetical protein ACJAZ9_000270 [Neolewinella sp.]|jgi:hypothetical protein
MKYTFFILFCIILCCLNSCQNDSSHSSESNGVKSTYSFAASLDQDTSSYIPLYLHDIPTDVNARNTTTGIFGQFTPPDLARYQTQVLTKSIWTFEFYVDNNASRPQRMAGTGQWFQFNGDGSFKGGHWQHQTHSGGWSINYTTKHPTLVIDSNVDGLDAWWEIQGITDQQDAMAWVRVSDSGVGLYRKRIQGRLMELSDRPTKEQFAGQFNFK